MPGHDGEIVGLELGQRAFLEVEPQAGFALFRVRPVTGVAVVGKDRADVAIEINLRGGGDCGMRQEDNQQATEHLRFENDVFD